MKHHRIILALAVTGLSFGAFAQSSQKITAGKANEYGLVYSLPRTVIDLYIEAELTERHPGEFHNYAKRYLGTDNAIHADSYSAAVLSTTVVPRGIATDADRQLAQFKAGSSAYINLTPDNLPLGINTDEEYVPDAPEPPVARPAAPSPLETEGARQAVTAEMARSASLSKKAELAAQRIFELRETRSDILSGNADNPPADGAAMELVLANLAAQEAALTAMFEGTTTTHTVVRKVTLEPDTTGAQVVARISAVDGIVGADNLAGAPLTAEFTVLEKGVLPVNEKGLVKTYPKGGVAYCIPGTAQLTLRYGGKTIAEEDVTLSQLGVVFGLDPGLFTDKREPYKVVFDPATGAIINLAPMEK